MNRQFIEKLMIDIDFPKEAQAYFSDIISKLGENELAELDRLYKCVTSKKHDWSSWCEEILPPLNELSEKTGIHKYSMEMIFALDLAQEMKKIFDKRGYAPHIFIDTAMDFRYKLDECKTVYDVWGTFVSAWYPIFYTGNLIKLGRLEYEICDFDYDMEYTGGGITLKKGDPVLSVHIPSSGPLTEELCFESYKLAYDFFKDMHGDKPLVLICHSWLFHHSTEKVLSPSSNTVRFIHDFDVVEQEDTDSFHDKWRVFGAGASKSDADLPEDTSMQRAYKKYLLEGGKTGAALAILVFDGERITNKK